MNFSYENISEAKTAKAKIMKDEIFSKNNLTIKRPGGGLSPMKWDDLLGTRASKDYNEDDYIL